MAVEGKRPGVATATVSRPPAPEAEDDDDELIFVSAQPGNHVTTRFPCEFKLVNGSLNLILRFDTVDAILRYCIIYPISGFFCHNF